MTFKLFKVFFLVLILLVSIILACGNAIAYSFNKNLVMADSIFNASGTMSATQIDSWLNSHYGSASCISTNHGFKAPEPIGYSSASGFKYGGDVTAGTIIYNASRVYALNPRAVLATLEKEESLVSGGSGCNTLRYASAVGYGCPDSGGSYNYSGFELYSINGKKVTSVRGTCVKSSKYVGFSRQVIYAVWQLKFGQQRAVGNVNWNVQVRNFPHSGNSWDNSDDPFFCYGAPYSGFMTAGNWANGGSGSGCTATHNYDGKYTIDSTVVSMNSGATASLYTYTPHISGNQSFFNIYTGWFGSTSFAWAASPTLALYTDSGRSNPISNISDSSGATYYVTLTAKNTGSSTWIGGSTQIAKINASSFANGSWIDTSHPVRLNESSVAPNSTGHFYFSITLPNIDGSYSETFQLVERGSNGGWMQGSTFTISATVSNPYNGKITGNSTFQNSDYTGSINIAKTWLVASQEVYVKLTAKNVGQNGWTSSAQVGAPGGVDSPFCKNGDWIDCQHPARVSPATVSTGSSGAFQFPMKAPNSSQLYNQQFQLVQRGLGGGWMPGGKFSELVRVYATTPSQMTSGQYFYYITKLASSSGVYRLTLQHDGNLVLYHSAKAIWASHTNGKPITFLTMQGDGNLVLYGGGKAYWSSHTNGGHNPRLAIQNDGNMVVYSGSKPVWSTHTNGK